MSKALRHRLLWALIGALAGGASSAIAQQAHVTEIRTSGASRTNYLAHATIWRDPGPLSPADLLKGPQAAFPVEVADLTTDAVLSCTFVRRGRDLGGNTAKFLCRTGGGHELRVKYWDPELRHGNREVFAAVAASRLMWALGFEAVPAVTLDVRCEGCPEDPENGTGITRSRRYIALLEAAWPTPALLSTADANQGWSWRELDAAIRSLPPGEERQKQRTFFDALSLLGVFLQHGDRKSEQQRLYCASLLDTVDQQKTLIEPPGARLCATAAVAIVDIGATFGGAGRSSSDTTATMNLEAWRRKRIFSQTSDGSCRGELIVSLNAGRDGEGNPPISEEGRAFLNDRLHSLTLEHIHAIFSAARVEQLETTKHESGGDRSVDSWVAAFLDKAGQIENGRCRPAS